MNIGRILKKRKVRFLYTSETKLPSKSMISPLVKFMTVWIVILKRQDSCGNPHLNLVPFWFLSNTGNVTYSSLLVRRVVDSMGNPFQNIATLSVTSEQIKPLQTTWNSYMNSKRNWEDTIFLSLDLEGRSVKRHIQMKNRISILGGMYAAWMRMKYPHVLHGAIAASAPIWGFLGMDPPIDYAYFDKIKTYDAYKQGDPDGNCVSNIRRTWETIIELADDPDYGFKAIKSALGICQSTFLFSMNDAWNIIFWIDHAISIMAEGSFSFPSDYMTYGLAPLPIYPLKVGCSYLKDELYGYELLEGSSLCDRYFRLCF